MDPAIERIPLKKTATKPARTALVFFLAFAIVTVFVWVVTATAVSNVRQQSFLNHAARLENQVNASIERVHDLLAVFAVLFSASEQVTADEFALAQNSLEENKPIAGRLATLYLQFVNNDEKTTFEQEQNVSIDPPGDRTTYLVATYLESVGEQTVVSLGHDVLAEPSLSDAALQARETGDITIALLSKTDDALVDTFVLFKPICSGLSTMPTQIEREQRCPGVVAVAFNAQKFFYATINDLELEPGISAEIIDKNGSERIVFAYEGEAPLYTGQVIGPLFEQYSVVTFAGRRWEIRVSAADGFGFTRGQSLVRYIIFVGGILLCLLGAGLGYSVASARRRAVQLAHAMTKTIRESDKAHLAMIQAVPEPILVADKRGRLFHANSAAVEAFALQLERSKGELVTSLGFFTPHAKPILLRNMSAAFHGRPTTVSDLKTRLRGQDMTFELRTRPLLGEGKIVGVVLLLVDVTAQRTLAAQIEKQKYDLERINRFMVGRELKMRELKKKLGERGQR